MQKIFEPAQESYRARRERQDEAKDLGLRPECPGVLEAISGHLEGPELNCRTELLQTQTEDNSERCERFLRYRDTSVIETLITVIFNNCKRKHQTHLWTNVKQ